MTTREGAREQAFDYGWVERERKTQNTKTAYNELVCPTCLMCLKAEAAS
jgi:hypothetical protein